MPRVPDITLTKGTSVSATATAVKGPAFRRELTGDRQVNDLQEELRKAGQRAAALPFGNGRLYRDVAFAANALVTLKHGFGVKARFMILNPTNGNMQVAPSPNPPPSATLDKTQIILQAVVSGTADVWLYQ